MSSVAGTRFALIGAGGLGGPIAYALAAAGAAELLICDDDIVDLSNLQRQIQFTTPDVGRAKVVVIAEELIRRGYPAPHIHSIRARFTAENAPALLARVDFVLDCSDNFATKFLVNDQAIAAGLPFVISGVLRYGGQVLAVQPGVSGCYRCLFEAPPDDELSCAEAGILGATVAVIAGWAAGVAIAMVDGNSADPSGELLVFNDLRRDLVPRKVGFRRRPGCLACAATERADAPA